MERSSLHSGLSKAKDWIASSSRTSTATRETSRKDKKLPDSVVWFWFRNPVIYFR